MYLPGPSDLHHWLRQARRWARRGWCLRWHHRPTRRDCLIRDHHGWRCVRCEIWFPDLVSAGVVEPSRGYSEKNLRKFNAIMDQTAARISEPPVKARRCHVCGSIPDPKSGFLLCGSCMEKRKRSEPVFRTTGGK
jgi:hypothetical protein